MWAFTALKIKSSKIELFRWRKIQAIGTKLNNKHSMDTFSFSSAFILLRPAIVVQIEFPIERTPLFCSMPLSMLQKLKSFRKLFKWLNDLFYSLSPFFHQFVLLQKPLKPNWVTFKSILKSNYIAISTTFLSESVLIKLPWESGVK